MDRLFSESFVRPGAAFPAFGMEGPSVDIYQTADDLVVKAALPGSKSADLQISVRGALTLRLPKAKAVKPKNIQIKAK